MFVFLIFVIFFCKAASNDGPYRAFLAACLCAWHYYEIIMYAYLGE